MSYANYVQGSCGKPPRRQPCKVCYFSFSSTTAEWAARSEHTHFLIVSLSWSVTGVHFFVKWNIWEIYRVGFAWKHLPTPEVIHRLMSHSEISWRLQRSQVEPRVPRLQFNVRYIVAFSQNCGTLFHPSNVTCYNSASWWLPVTSVLLFVDTV